MGQNKQHIKKKKTTKNVFIHEILIYKWFYLDSDVIL